MKKTILMMAIAIATVTAVSCDKKAKTEAATEHEALDHSKGEPHQLAYVCPMDCEKGKTYDAVGKCPVCGMDLVEKKHTKGDGHEHSKKEADSIDKEHGHSHGNEGHDH